MLEWEEYSEDLAVLVAGDALKAGDSRALGLLAIIPSVKPVKHRFRMSPKEGFILTTCILQRVNVYGDLGMLRYFQSTPPHNHWPNAGFVGLVDQRSGIPALVNKLFVGPGLYPP